MTRLGESYKAIVWNLLKTFISKTERVLFRKSTQNASKDFTKYRERSRFPEIEEKFQFFQSWRT